MTLKINGKEEAILKDRLFLTELLKLKEVKTPEMVSVQLNGEFVDRNEFEKTRVKENDEVDFLYFMGGGSK